MPLGLRRVGFGPCKCLQEGHTPSMSCLKESLSFTKDILAYQKYKSLFF